MSSFAELAKMKLSDIQRPENPPMGTYIVTVKGPGTIREFTSGDVEYEAVDFKCVGVQALHTDDDELLERVGGPKAVVVTQTFMFNKAEEEAASREKSMYSMRRIFEVLGFDEEQSISECMAMAGGRNFTAEINYRPDTRNEGQFYLNLKSYSAIE